MAEPTETGKTGKLELREGADPMRMTDDELRKARLDMVAARMEVSKKFNEMGDDRFATPEGNQLFGDLNYYSGVISRLECEMAYRLITL